MIAKDDFVWDGQLLLLFLYQFKSTPEPRMYLDHEGNRTGDFRPSWGQPNTRVHIRTIEAPRTPRSRGGERYECHFHASQKHEHPGQGKTTQAPPRTTRTTRAPRPDYWRSETTSGWSQIWKSDEDFNQSAKTLNLLARGCMPAHKIFRLFLPTAGQPKARSAMFKMNWVLTN